MSQANHMSVSVRPTNALPFSTMREKVDQSQMDRSNIEGFEYMQNEEIGDTPNSNGDFDRPQYVPFVSSRMFAFKVLHQDR